MGLGSMKLVTIEVASLEISEISIKIKRNTKIIQLFAFVKRTYRRYRPSL